MLEQLGVGHDHLLAGDAAQAGGLEADPLDRAGRGAVADRCRRGGTAGRTRSHSAANRSEKMPCAARPMAMPPMPRPATSAVTLTPRLSRMTIIAIANSATLTSTRMIAIALPSVDLAWIVADAAADHADDQFARPDRRLQRGGDDEQYVGEAGELRPARRHRWQTMSIAAATMKRMLVFASTRPMTPCQRQSGSRGERSARRSSAGPA